MKTAFQRSFGDDLRSAKDQKLLDRVADLIESIEQAADLTAIPNLKKLRGPGPYYRVRLGDYRVGLMMARRTEAYVDTSAFSAFLENQR